MAAPFTGRHTARNPAARPRPFFLSRFQQLKEVARETDRCCGGVFTPQERALTLLAQPPQSTERGRSVNSRLLVGGCLAVWSVALIAAQAGPSTPQKPAATPAAQAKPAPQPRTGAVGPSPPPGLDQAAVRKLLDQYCLTCHNARMKTGGLVLEQSQLNLATFGDHADLGERIVRKLRAVQMPPTGLPRPNPETMESMIRWMENELDAQNVHHLPAPRLHRTNRT